MDSDVSVTDKMSSPALVQDLCSTLLSKFMIIFILKVIHQSHTKIKFLSCIISKC